MCDSKNVLIIVLGVKDYELFLKSINHDINTDAVQCNNLIISNTAVNYKNKCIWFNYEIDCIKNDNFIDLTFFPKFLLEKLLVNLKNGFNTNYGFTLKILYILHYLANKMDVEISGNINNINLKCDTYSKISGFLKSYFLLTNIKLDYQSFLGLYNKKRKFYNNFNDYYHIDYWFSHKLFCKDTFYIPSVSDAKILNTNIYLKIVHLNYLKSVGRLYSLNNLPKSEIIKLNTKNTNTIKILNSINFIKQTRVKHFRLDKLQKDLELYNEICSLSGIDFDDFIFRKHIIYVITKMVIRGVKLLDKIECKKFISRILKVFGDLNIESLEYRLICTYK